MIIESKPKIIKAEIIVERYDGTKEIRTTNSTILIKKKEMIKRIIWDY